MMYILVFLFSSLAFSSEVSFSYTDGMNIDYVVPYEDSGKWFIDEYQVAPGKLQQRIKQKIYNNSLDWSSDYQKIISNKKLSHIDSNSRANMVDTENPRAVVWTTKANWDLSWEVKFQKWVKENVGPNFYKDNNIATDCADAMFSLRWIFSRINSLSMGNTLAGSRKIFSNESFISSWTNLKRDEQWNKDKVFLAALDYILDNTYTGTLYEDSMPVKITPTTFAEGNFFLTMRGAQSMGHTEVVYNIDKNPGRINYMYSDVPRKVRILYSSTAYPQFVDPYRYSLRSMKWVKKNSAGKWLFVPLEQHPHYSQEQFTAEFVDGFDKFYNALFYRLGISYDYKKHYSALRDRQLSQIKDRVAIVKNGYEFCLSNNCDPGTGNYEVWSTPSRDQKIVDTFAKISEVLQQANSSDLQNQYNDYLVSTEIKIDDEHRLNLLEIKEKFENQRFTFDPRDQVLARWGL